jgi:dTDP-4-amino-4,6-dideoxygalactose transaminase
MLEKANKIRTINYINLKEQYLEEKIEIDECIHRVFSSGNFVAASGVLAFEDEIAAHCGVKYAIAVSSGTAALVLSLISLNIGPGDEVITPPNSHFASTGAIIHVGATPVFVDVTNDQNIDPSLIERAITQKTKAIMPVHLCGRVCDLDPILELAKKHNLHIIEDAAQAIGATYHGKMAGSFGLVNAFSAHPLKILNAGGDAGYITTNDESLAIRIKRLRNLGLASRNKISEWSDVSRMDAIQAEVLRVRLPKLAENINRRRAHAKIYEEILDRDHIWIAPERDYEFNAYHTFAIMIEKRDELQDYLTKQNITTYIHYPIPIHLQAPAATLGYKRGDFPKTEYQANTVLSLPIHQQLSPGDIAYVAEHINKWINRN